MHDCYDRWHPLFPELPDSLPIVCGITAYGKCIGLTRSGWEHGPRITIASNMFATHETGSGARIIRGDDGALTVVPPRIIAGGKNIVADIMVHEMLHAWLHVTDRDTGHKSEDWYAAVRRLSPAVLGHELDVRRGAERKSVRVKLDDGRSVVRKVKVPEYEGLHDRVSRWPGAFRPAGWDRGVRLDCPSY